MRKSCLLPLSTPFGKELGSSSENVGNDLVLLGISSANSWGKVKLKISLTGDQLQFIAKAIFSRYRWLKASEVMLFFFNFKAGFYERFYGHFDTQTIIRSFKTFLEERALTIAAYEREQR